MILPRYELSVNIQSQISTNTVVVNFVAIFKGTFTKQDSKMCGQMAQHKGILYCHGEDQHYTVDTQ